MTLLVGPRHSFLASLSFQDLRRLRKVAFKVMDDLGYPQDLRTTTEADRLIESFGPKIAEERIRQAVDSGFVT